jgi:redox-regulated HSP33 family molecular chaperone
MITKYRKTIHLTKKEIEAILIEHLRRSENVQDGVKISVNFNHGTRLEGYGQMEHEVSYFGGAAIEITH